MKTKKKTTVAVKPEPQSQNQNTIVFTHLMTHGRINTLDAINKYGILRLGAVIFNVKKALGDTMTIKMEKQNISIKGRKASVAKYIVEGWIPWMI